MKKKIITVIAACYNESGNLESLYNRVKSVFDALDNYDFELLYVDNVSTDDSLMIYHSLVEQDDRVKVIIMSRNFGESQPSFLAGLHHAKGDGIVLMDGDIQDPPGVIATFIPLWEEGFDVVYGIRKRRKGSIIRRFFYFCFYRIFNWLSYLNIPLDAGDFGIMDRRVVEAIKKLPEKDVYIRGLRSWVGFRQVGVSYVRDDRQSGKTSINFFRNFFWAKRAIVSFSYKPLEYISAFASLAVVMTIIASIFYCVRAFTTDMPRGFPTILLALFFFSTIQMLTLSILAEYIMRIFHEVKGRPAYLIDRILHKE
ncbi:glycosyltransferase family 2 protein [Candidatus Babeliales bacterium]|nr:glycosyltransferase family 2 protein [Candidatus Babeliales bacterium]